MLSLFQFVEPPRGWGWQTKGRAGMQPSWHLIPSSPAPLHPAHNPGPATCQRASLERDRGEGWLGMKGPLVTPFAPGEKAGQALDPQQV